MGKEQIEEGLTLDLAYDKLQKIVEKNADVLPVVVQDIESKDVLILAYINSLALETSFKTRKATFWSTSRQELWIKGQTSGQTLSLMDVRVNCEQNSLLFLVRKEGVGVCHTQDKSDTYRSTCFYRSVHLDDGHTLEWVNG